MSRLENVGTDQQASEANLKSKSYLCEIVFSWNTTNTSSDHSLKVLENLEPHTNLEKLTIEKYCGGKFPNWLSKVNFPNMVILHLINCSFCGSLPSLGNLSSIQQLHISKMNNLESLNFGFDSIQKLTIEDCEKLMGELPDDTYLPCLQDLKLLNCPKLSIFSGEGMLIDSFSQIGISKILSEQLCGLPSLEEPEIASRSISLVLQILGKGLSGLTSLEELQITSLSISLLSDLQILGEGLSGLTSLKNLHIRNWKMPAELPNLQSLVITDCKELEEWGSKETTNKCDGEKESSKESCLPDTLISLCINIRPRKQRGSHEMESLIDFEITGKCNEEWSFPEVGPPLRISSLLDLEKLVEGFQHLTSLSFHNQNFSNLASQ